MQKIKSTHLFLFMAIIMLFSLISTTKLEASSYIKFNNKASSFQWPLNNDYNVSSFYGVRRHPVYGRNIKHNGIDISASQGTSIHSINAGVVKSTGFQSARGYYIIIKNGDIQVLYQHLKQNSIKVKVGDTITKGEVIAEVGNTGVSTGPHLHLEVYKNNVLTNPLSYTYHKYSDIDILDDNEPNIAQETKEKEIHKVMIKMVKAENEDNDEELFNIMYNN